MTSLMVDPDAALRKSLSPPAIILPVGKGLNFAPAVRWTNAEHGETKFSSDHPAVVSTTRPTVIIDRAAEVTDSVKSILAASRQAVLFAEQLPANRIAAAPSQDLLDLAKRAVASCRARKDEDVDVWAERLARDVGHLTD